MVPTILTEDELRLALRSLPAWTLENNRLHVEYKFRDFVEAFGFLVQVALAAEAVNHHPEWSNVYNRVRIDLTTHEAGGVTQRDIDLARRVDATAATFSRR
mgnify:CR=1 FL=1